MTNLLTGVLYKNILKDELSVHSGWIGKALYVNAGNFSFDVSFQVII